MKETNRTDNSTITVCACSSRNFIDKSFVARTAAKAVRAGYKVRLVDDLCKLIEESDSGLAEIAGGIVAACHPRAVKSLFSRMGLEPASIYNLRTREEIFSGIEPDDDETELWKTRIMALPSCYGTDAWFPTIDKTLCAECGKCLDFCPFGVYSMVNDRVTVTCPARCKNNCPACARTCPAGAVIFPKHETGPINGGPAETQQVSSSITTAAATGSSVVYADALRRRLQERRNSGIRFLNPEDKTDEQEKDNK